MNKRFLSAILFGALMVTSTGTFVSCKDYDDDIDNLETKYTSLSSDLAAQQTSLTAALTTAQNDATAAKSAAAAAQTTADKALALAASAAAEAKAAAIKEALAQTTVLLAGKANASDVVALASKIEGIQKNLSTFDETLKAMKVTIDAQAKYDEAVKVQIAALEKYQQTSGQDITSIKQDLVNIKSQLSTIVSEAQIEALITKANEALKKELGAQISTLDSVIANRLTSIAFVPEQYIDGIPTIVFKTLQYTPQTFNALHAAGSNNPETSGATTSDAQGAVIKTISNKETIAQYRLNPTGVDKNDIQLPSFVSSMAVNSTRSAAKENYPVGVVAGQDINIEDGILKLKVEKTMTDGSLNPAMTNGNVSGETDGKFYIVSLKTPIAKANLTAEEKKAGTDFHVFSEYVRVAEKAFVPFMEKAVKSTSGVTLANAKEAWETGVTPVDQHYKDSTILYNSEVNKLLSWTVPYNKSVDLKKLVAACEFNNDLAKQDVKFNEKDYGLAFRFYVAKAAYNTLGGAEGNTNKTNQQEFAAIDSPVNGLLTSKVYSVGGGGTSATAVGREPIIRIELRDTVNNKLVCQRYMKIKWTMEASVVEPITLEGYTFADAAYTCGDYEGRVGTKEMNEKIYNAVKEGGMTKAQFHSIYKNCVKVSGDGDISEVPNTESEVDSYNLIWTLTHAQVGTIWQAASKEYKITIKYSDPTKVNADVLITLTRKIIMPELGINGHLESYWEGQNVWNVFKVNPFVYLTQNLDKTVISNPTCNIYTDLKNGFVKDGNKVATTEDIVKGFNCDKVSIEFDESRLAAFVSKYGFTNATLSLDKKTLYVDGAKAAIIADLNIAYPNNPAAPKSDWIQLVETTPYNAPVGSAVAAPAAIKLIDKNIPVKIVADLCGDGINTKVVKSYEVHIIKPLTIDAKLGGDFEDAVISGSRIGVKKAFTFTDWNGYSVAETVLGTTEKLKYSKDLWDYYQVKTAEWNTSAIKTNLKVNGEGNVVATEGYKEGKLPTNVTINYDSATNELVYYNQSGTPVLNDYKVYIPVSVSYKWGTETKYVEATVKGAAGSAN